VPVDQKKILRDFRARPELGTVRGRCTDPFSEPAPAGEREACVLTVRDHKAFEQYVRENGESLFPARRDHALSFRKIQ
jgi:hypothetical protein